MRVAVLKGGRSLERKVSLRSGARVEDALQRLGHDVVAIDVGPTSSTACCDVRPDVAFVALHGRGGEDGTVQELLELVGVPYTASGPSACSRCMDKVVAKHELRAAGLPTPDFYAFSQAAFEELGAGARAAGARGAARLPDRRQARRAGLGARHQVRPHRRRRAGARSSPRSRTTPRCCSSATSRAATSPSRCSTARTGRRRCRSSRRSRTRRTSTTSRRATRSAAPTFVCPALTRSRRRPRGRRSSPWPRTRRSAARASRAST